MPVEFLSNEQAARYGRYHADPSPEQLARFFYLSPADVAFLAPYRLPHTRLGCAVQLCTLRFLGTFLPAPTQVPALVVRILADQLQVPSDDWHTRYTRPNTVYDHQAQLVAYLAYRVFEDRQAFQLTRWLYAQVSTSTVRPGVLFDLATAYLVAQRVVLSGVSLLARLIARVRGRTGRALYRQVQARLSGAQRDRLDALLVAAPGERLTPLEVLRTPPTRVSAPALMAALRRLDQIRAVGVGAVPVQDLPEARLACLARHAQLAWAQPLGRLGGERRHATLLVFMQTLERTATDDVLDLFDNLMTALALSGETRRRRERLRTLKDLDAAALVLQQAVRILLDEAVPATSLRQQVLDTVGETQLRAAAEVVQNLASDDDPVLQVLSGSYASVRRFLPALLAGISLEGTPSAKHLLAAWHFLQAQGPVAGAGPSGPRPRARWYPQAGRSGSFRPKAR